MACPVFRKNLYVIAKPQLFTYFGWFLYRIGCIPSTKLEDKKQGLVDSIYTRFKKRKIKLAISPKGTTKKADWRSGYYWLRKKLKADVMVCGLDYEKKKLISRKLYKHEKVRNYSLEKMNKLLKKDIGYIVPLYPKNSEVKIKIKYNKKNINIISIENIIVISIIIIVLILLCIIIYKTARKKSIDIKNSIKTI
jgi:1-acyl-sn-glycerol-3-phosphate acyltransferase